MLGNYPAMKREDVALAVIETVIPALAVAIDEAAQDVAANLFGDEATTFDIERIANDVLFALGDFLSLAPIPRRGVTDLLRVHQLQNTAYAEDYFGVRADEETPCEFTLTETERALVESPVLQNFAEREEPTYVPAIVSAPTEPAPRVVVDNRPTRTLDDIKREVSGITRRPVTPIHYLQVDQRDEETRVERQRAQLEQKKRIEQNVSDYISILDKRKDAKLDGMDVCDYVNCQGLFKPSNPRQKYCSDQCRSAACRKRKADDARRSRQTTSKGRERLF